MASTTPQIRVKLMDGFQLLAVDDAGHSVVLDAPRESGGEGAGFTPGRLFLAAIAGCSAMDVALILRRKRQPFKGIQVTASGEQKPDYPRYYHQIHLHYTIIGEGVSEVAVKDAIRLSMDVYCSVGATVSGKSEITTSYEILRQPAPAEDQPSQSLGSY